MPTFKHPCPYCGKFIDRAVAACPFCSQPDPFAPKRCQNCRKIVEDMDWVTCPYCGASLSTIPVNAASAGEAASAGLPAQPPAQPAPSGPAQPASVDPAQTNGGAWQPTPLVQLERPPLYQEPGSADAPAPQPAGKCSGCGAPMGAGARFCTVCGTMAG